MIGIVNWGSDEQQWELRPNKLEVWTNEMNQQTARDKHQTMNMREKKKEEMIS